MDQTGYLSYDQTNSNSVEFSLLLQLGLDYSQKWSAASWTDFNQHDPGVTILEQLCYAITDLNYRASFSVADILAEQPQESVPGRTSFFTGNLILTGNALTITDYRKYLFDAMTAAGASNFKNVWLEPAASTASEPAGLYDIFIETLTETPDCQEDQGTNQGNGKNTQLINHIHSLYQQSRNLTEDVRHIHIMQHYPILVAAIIEIDVNADPNQVLAQVMFQIQNYLVPFVNILSPEKLLQDGVPPGQVYQGPLLERGVIADNQFTDLLAAVSVTTINNLMLGVAGVVSVFNLTVNGQSGGTVVIVPTGPGEPRVARLSPSIFQNQGSYPIQLIRHGKTLLVDPARVSALIAAQISPFANSQSPAVQNENNKEGNYTQLPKGTNRDIAAYYSIQRQFPRTFGISENGPQLLQSVGEASARANTTRLAQVKQLKAWLLFFEQILTDSLAQLSNAARLFSLDETLDRSYFGQSLVNPDIGPPDLVELQLLMAPPVVPGKGYRYSVHVHAHDPCSDTPGELVLRSPWFNNEADAASTAALMLKLGQESSSYQVRKLPNNEFHLLLLDQAHRKIAFGAQRFGSRASAEAAMIGLVLLMRELACNAHLRASCMSIVKHAPVHNVAAATSEQERTVAYYLANLNALIQRHDPFYRRRNRFLDNLLARFNESFDDALLLAADPRPGYLKQNFQQDLIHWKNGFLKHYAPIVRTRTSAFSSQQSLGGTRGKGLNPVPDLLQNPGQNVSNLSGMEQRMRYLLGLRSAAAPSLDEGLHTCDYQYVEDTRSQPEGATGEQAGRHRHRHQHQHNNKAAFVFQSPHPTILRSLLAYGKDEDNYSLEKEPGGSRYRILFLWPDAVQAHQVHLASSEAAAHAAIKAMIKYLIDYESTDKNYYLDETMYVVDHILLRQREGGRQTGAGDAGCATTATSVPEAFYSFRVSLMFPNWPLRFQDPAFRELACNTALKNCPAHVEANNYWLDTGTMAQFRSLYATWLALLTADPAHPAKLNAASANLAVFINQLTIHAG